MAIIKSKLIISGQETYFRPMTHTPVHIIAPIQLDSFLFPFGCLFMIIVIIIISLKFMRPKFHSFWMSHKRQSHL